METRSSSISSLNQVSVTAMMSTGLIESDADNSSNIGKSDRALSSGNFLQCSFLYARTDSVTGFSRIINSYLNKIV